MSLRAIWIVSISQDFGKVIYHRCFRTVERRAQKIYNNVFVGVPLCEEFSKSLLVKLGLNSSKEFLEWRDSACCKSQLPVLSLMTSKGELWPVLVTEKHGHLFCCLPLVEERFNNELKIPLFQIQSVSVGFSVLLGIISFLGPNIPNATSQKFIDLDNYLSLSMPFGQASDTEPSIVRALSSLPESETKTVKNIVKQPAWKPISYKGKSSISINIIEYIRSSQFGQDMQTVLDVYGEIIMKVELEASQNDLYLTISNVNSLKNLSLDSLVLHPCVQMSTSSVVSREGVIPTSRKLHITPPLHQFMLCCYTAPYCKDPPIHGILKLRVEKFADLLLQLSLSEYMRTTKNYFDFCEARISFFQKEYIKKIDFNPTCGSVQISEDKHTVIWNIGQKFPGKNFEVSLTAKVYFHDKSMADVCSDEGKNSYAQIFFKQSNFTFSGCCVDSKSVHISPPSKVKVQIEQEVQSSEYKIWNSYGDTPFYSTSSN